MFRPEMVPGEWGALQTEAPRTLEEIEAKARSLLAQMTLDEKIHQMSGDTPTLPGLIEMAHIYNIRPIPAGENLRLGIPGIRFTDGPRGVVMNRCTCFPVSMGRGATWDTALEEQIGDAIGVEGRALGANLFAGVCINLLRHPAWGRAQETYGEDAYLLGEMGAALVRGVQRHIMACAKHYACNSIENTRLKVNVRIAERTLREVYLPHFKRCVEEGIASIMSAYNRVNGEYCGHNRHLLSDILKQDWGFQGFTISDFVWGVRDGKSAALAGLDIEMPFTMHYGKKLKKLVKNGQVPEAAIDDAVVRILRQKIRFAQVGEPGRYTKEAIASPQHAALARKAAQESLVLLQNDLVEGVPVLPLEAAKIGKLAVIGKLAAQPNIGDLGSSQVHPPYVITPLEGIKAAVEGKCEVFYSDGRRLEEACAAARKAEAVVVVVGYTSKHEGEAIGSRGGDRASLRLPLEDELLILAVAAENKRTVVVMMGGSAIITEAWRSKVAAMVMAWYPGMEGGHAVADLLFGRINPSGRLPCSFPKSEAQLPFFDGKADSIEYGYYHGYRLMEKEGMQPAFPFGFGLSYTTFAYRNVRVEEERVDPDGSVLVGVEVANTGDRGGDEVVQLYVGIENSSIDRPHKELKGFYRVHLEAGEVKTVSFDLLVKQLAYYDDQRAEWVVEPGKYMVYVGSSSADGSLLKKEFEVKVS